MQPTVIEHVATDTSVYGTFSLAGAEFALSALSIQEVVNAPDSYSSIPLSPDYLLGVFNLRGSVVPVIDLRKIFGIELSEEDKDVIQKVAILEYGNLCLGVLFDSTGEIFNSNDVEKSLFVSRGESDSEQVVMGVFKMNEGRRIVQILDVYGMLRLDKIPHSGAQYDRKNTRNRGRRHQCISFYIGGCCCALDIGTIREIVKVDNIENSILASELCLGAIDIRGDTVPIVDTAKLMGYGNTDRSSLKSLDSYSIVVMSIQDNLIGLRVDSIENIVTYFDDELVEFPVLAEAKAEMFLGCVLPPDTDKHIIVLKSSEILSGEEVNQITRGHSQLYADTNKSLAVNSLHSLERKTLITFSIDRRYGLNINDVREVIDYPSNLIRTPAMSENISGVANLRGELVAIIDSRVLYGMSETKLSDSSKVLIFDQAGSRQGLVVDSVDSIISFSSNEVANIPDMVFRRNKDGMNQDVKEALIIKTSSGEEDTVCILDLDAMALRAAA